VDQAQMIGVGVGLGVPLLLLLIVFIKTHTVICQPNELVILSGRGERGYRVLKGGYGFRRPFVESVARLPLTLLPIELHLHKVMCQGMIPVRVEARANVKMAGSEKAGMDAAIERFLGKGSEAVRKASEQALEGALRGVLATRDPEAANLERLEICAEAAERARKELADLGILLGFLQIQELADEQGYLEAIGRKRSAEVNRDARVAEARAEAEARKVAAEQKRLGREAEIAAELEVIEKENALAVRRSELEAAARKASQKAAVAGEITRVEEETELQARRAELAEKREQADTVIPARAEKEALTLRAEGASAQIREDGRATAAALEEMRGQWADGEAKDLFLIQLLPTLLDKVTRVVADNLRIDKLTILDGGDGQGLPNAVKNLTNSAVVMVEQVKNATGIDLGDLARQEGRQDAAELPKELDS